MTKTAKYILMYVCICSIYQSFRAFIRVYLKGQSMAEEQPIKVPKAIQKLFHKGFTAFERQDLDYAIELLYQAVELSLYLENTVSRDEGVFYGF